MLVMHKVNLRTIDLNLLVILQALLLVKHVTKASQQLNMSQPAVSRALQRLRKVFNDPLLIRTSIGFDLSARGSELLPKLNELLLGVEYLISEPTFNPEKASDVIRVFGLDLEATCFIPALNKILRTEAPNMHLEVRTETRDHFELLDKDDVHFVFSAMSPSANEGQYHRTLIMQSDSVCIMSTNHPDANNEITLDKYLTYHHGLVSITGIGNGFIDDRLLQLGKKRKRVLRLSSFMVAAEYCENTDLIFLLPEIISSRLIKGRDLVIKQVPDELKSVPINFYLYWHERYHNDPMCRWLRRRILSNLSVQ